MKILVVVFASFLGMLISGFAGYKIGGKTIPLTQTEMNRIDDEKSYQILPKNADLTEALAGGHYSHCVVYPGVGLFFSHKDMEGNLVVEQAPISYPARTSNIMPGYRVVTPLHVLMGELNSPVKVEFKKYINTESVILNRVMVKKCYRIKDAAGQRIELPDNTRTNMNQ